MSALEAASGGQNYFKYLVGAWPPHHFWRRGRTGIDPVVLRRRRLWLYGIRDSVNPKSEAEAVKLYRPFVIKTARQFKGVLVDDLIQEGLLAVAIAFRKWRIDGGANFLTWIRQPVYFAMLNYSERNQKRGGTFRDGIASSYKLVPGDAQTLSMDAESDSTSEEGDEGQSLHDKLGAGDEPLDVFALKRLPNLMFQLTSRQREIIRLRYIEEMTPDEVAEDLGLTRQALILSEVNAIRRLKQLLVRGEKEES